MGDTHSPEHGANQDLSATLRLYTQCLFEARDIVEIRRLPSGRSSWHKAGELPAWACQLSADNGRGETIYVGVNPRTRVGGTKRRDVLARCLVADVDGCAVEAALGRWGRTGLPQPTLAVDSGCGTHLYLRLAEPIWDRCVWRWAQRRLSAAVGADPAVDDPLHVIRLPGLINHKGPPRLCRIIDAHPGNASPFAALRSVLATLKDLESGGDSPQ